MSTAVCSAPRRCPVSTTAREKKVPVSNLTDRLVPIDPEHLGDGRTVGQPISSRWTGVSSPSAARMYWARILDSKLS